MGNGANQSEKKRISERLLVLMRQHDLINKDLANLAGVSPSTVSGWLSGRRRPSRKNLQKIAKECNVTTDWLDGFTDVQFPVETDEDKRKRTACDYTGLDEKSIETIHLADNKQKAQMDILFSNPPLVDCIGCFVEDFEIKPKF
jgi:transcriptional regulator with XRE-family HTH domain